MSNLKKYNIFTFITTFAKLLIEVFIPLILYNMNFTIKEIILFLIIKHALCTIFLPITKLVIKKKSTTFLMIISSILFTLSYIYLNFLTKNLFKLLIFTTLLSMYLTFYWVGRHTYALSIIEDKKSHRQRKFIHNIYHSRRLIFYLHRFHFNRKNLILISIYNCTFLNVNKYNPFNKNKI